MEELVMIEFIKNLFCTRHYWIVVRGIFHESTYTTSPRQIYFTSVAVPIARNDMAEFMKSPSDFTLKALHDMHPEMKGFTICEFNTLGWYSSEEFINDHPFNFKEVTLKFTPRVLPGLKEVTVISRVFNNNIGAEVPVIIQHASDYVKYTLSTYMELSTDINI